MKNVFDTLRGQLHCIALQVFESIDGDKVLLLTLLYSIVRRPDSVEAPGEVAQ